MLLDEVEWWKEKAMPQEPYVPVPRTKGHFIETGLYSGRESDGKRFLVYHKHIFKHKVIEAEGKEKKSGTLYNCEIADCHAHLTSQMGARKKVKYYFHGPHNHLIKWTVENPYDASKYKLKF